MAKKKVVSLNSIKWNYEGQEESFLSGHRQAFAGCCHYRLAHLPSCGFATILARMAFYGYSVCADVLKENTYLSRTIEVQENQKVIDTGLYGIVRHPMYMATTVLFLAMPLVLASPISFLIMLLYIPLIAKRIKNEEKVLEEGLDGYKEYKQRVKYKVIPFIW